MEVIEFTADQLMALLEYLEDQRDAGYTLEDIIEGIQDGTITKTTNYANQS